MAKKTEEDVHVERRIRAWLEHEMELRGIDKAELARRIGADDGNVNRILSGARGLGLGMAVRISVGLGINLIQLLEENPKPKYFKDGLEPPPLPRRRTAKNKGD